MTTLEALNFLRKVRRNIKSAEHVKIAVYDDFAEVTLLVYGKFTIEPDMAGVEVLPHADLNALVLRIYCEETFPNDEL